MEDVVASTVVDVAMIAAVVVAAAMGAVVATAVDQERPSGRWMTAP
jgi:hypothetical protein